MQSQKFSILNLQNFEKPKRLHEVWRKSNFNLILASAASLRARSNPQSFQNVRFLSFVV